MAHPGRRLARVYIIDDAARVVSVTRIEHRRKVYE